MHHGGGVVSQIGTKTPAEIQAMRDEITRKPEAHMVLAMIDSLIPGTDDPLLGAICELINDYFVAIEDQADAS